jgi:SAM-dependent methyltransferase
MPFGMCPKSKPADSAGGSASPDGGAGSIPGHTGGVGFYQDQVTPRITDVVMNRANLRVIRDRVAAGLAGEVAEVGFGSGLNVPHYPPAVTRVLAVDPARLGRKLAARRIAASRVPVEFAGLDGERLPWPDDRIDHVLITWSLCTIPDPGRALAEICRVLRPGGTMHFVEHGRSPDPRVARWQDRLTPLQRRFSGGCHLGRPIGDLIAGSGLQITRLENYYVPGPKVLGYTFEGRAAKLAAAA